MNLHTLKDSARLLNLPYSLVYFYYREGHIPATRFGRYLLVDLNDVRAATANRKRKTA